MTERKEKIKHDRKPKKRKTKLKIKGTKTKKIITQNP